MPSLTRDEETALIRQAQDVALPAAVRQAARDRLVAEHLAAVWRIVDGKRQRLRELRLAAVDVAQEGVLALLGAIDRYDVSRAGSVRFISYAWTAVRFHVWAHIKRADKMRRLGFDNTVFLEEAPARPADPIQEHPPGWQDLSEFQQRVLTLHFGLDGGGERTFRQIGALLGVSSVSARKHGDAALELLRRRRRVRAA